MVSVVAGSDHRTIPVAGPRERGTFYAISIPKGEKYYISFSRIAGFSASLKGPHTHIKFAPVYWCLREHFFPVFEGPGEVLLYGPSPIREAPENDFQPERVLAFNVSRRFTAILPLSKRFWSQVANVLWGKIIWHFIDTGTAVVESHSYGEAEGNRGHPIKELLMHILGFFRF